MVHSMPAHKKLYTIPGAKMDELRLLIHLQPRDGSRDCLREQTECPHRIAGPFLDAISKVFHVSCSLKREFFACSHYLVSKLSIGLVTGM